jgi:hypothetical protein
MRHHVFIFAYLVSVCLVLVAHAAELRTVALTGQPAPGTAGGVTFESFGSYYFRDTKIFRGPVLNDTGQTAFRANLTGGGVDSANYQGVWSEGSGSLALVARTGSQAPGAAVDVNFGFYPGLELFAPVLNGAGQTAFYGALADGRLGLWSEGPGSLAMVVAEGVHAPVLPSGVSFSFAIIYEPNKDIFTDFPHLNDAGQTAVALGLTGTGVNNTNNIGSWSGVDLNNLALLAREGGQAAGSPAGAKYGDFKFPIGLNNAGQVALISDLQGSGINSSNDSGLWSGSAGGLALVARDGSPAPGTASGINFSDFFIPIEINSAGQVAFEAWLTGDDVVDGVNNEGVWSNVSGSLQLVARSGSQAAGAPEGVNYGLFSSSSWPLLNDSGQLAFHAKLAGSGVDESNNEGIWLGEPDNLALVTRLGQPAPGAPSGVNFSDFCCPALNSAGQIAFPANVAGDGIDFTNNRGIWATDASGALQLIARTGDILEVAPGDFRTLSNVDFVSLSSNSDGRRSAFNNFGQLVFWASFTDGSQGVFVSNKVATVPGDFNFDGTVDAADYVVWRKNDGTPSGYNAWRAHFGASFGPGSGSALPSADPLSAAVPEPATWLLVMALAGLCIKRPRTITLDSKPIALRHTPTNDPFWHAALL